MRKKIHIHLSESPMQSIPTAALLASLIATAGLLTAPLERRLFQSELSTRTKLWAYGGLMLMLWTFAAAALTIYGWANLRTSPPAATLWLASHKIAFVALGTIVAFFFLVAIQPLVQSVRGKR